MKNNALIFALQGAVNRTSPAQEIASRSFHIEMTSYIYYRQSRQLLETGKSNLRPILMKLPILFKLLVILFLIWSGNCQM